jgi:hypothetical protein
MYLNFFKYFYTVIEIYKMKYLSGLLFFLAIAIRGNSQAAPKVFDPCQKLDTNTIKQLIIGNWVDMNDTSHKLSVTVDSLTESILVMEGGVKKIHTSYWSYKFTDNIFSSDEVTCYSLFEYKEGFAHHIDYAINAISENYLLLGASGKMVFKRKN